MPNVVRNVGTLKHAKNVDGEEVHRSDYVKYGDTFLPALNTDTHFIYRSRRLGSALLCTCGGEGVTVGYHAYRKYSSYIGSEVIVCRHFFMNGQHADGSH